MLNLPGLNSNSLTEGADWIRRPRRDSNDNPSSIGVDRQIARLLNSNTCDIARWTIEHKDQQQLTAFFFLSTRHLDRLGVA